MRMLASNNVKPRFSKRDAMLGSMMLLEKLRLHHGDMMGEAKEEQIPEEKVPYTEVVVTRLPTIKMIIDETARYFNLSPVTLLSARRTKEILYPRFVAIWLSRELTLRSLPSVGRTFAGRDHTTILNACRKIQSMLTKDEKVKDDIDVLKLRIWDRLRLEAA